MSGETMVQIALDDLCSLKSTADVAQIYKKERDDVQKDLDRATRYVKAYEAMIAMDNVTVVDARNFLDAHDTPDAPDIIANACAIIRALLVIVNNKTPEVTP